MRDQAPWIVSTGPNSGPSSSDPPLVFDCLSRDGSTKARILWTALSQVHQQGLAQTSLQSGSLCTLEFCCRWRAMQAVGRQ